MFEGKHIHFSPLDNKPLCSYSSKLCRQRRLNGYAFCIRHILEDKSAPFKQCGFVTRNNYQKCLNAIPTNQERGYCHSHMQVAGIIPKTERKTKTVSPTAVVGSSVESPSEVSSFDVTVNNVISENEKQKFSASQDSRSSCTNESKGAMGMNTSSTQWNANTFHLKHGSTQGKSATSILSSSKSNNVNCPIDSSMNETRGHNKNQLRKAGNEVGSDNPGKKSSLSKTKVSSCVAEKSFLSNIVDPVNSCCNPVYTLCVRDRWKKFRFNSYDDDIPTKAGLKLKHMKAVQVLEKLPLFMEIPVQNASTIHPSIEAERKNENTGSFISSGVEVVLLPPLVNKKKLGNNIFTYTVRSGNENGKRYCNEKIDEKSSAAITSRMKAESVEGRDKLWEWESRKDFLSRVRQAFKRQYKTMMKVCKLREKMQRSDRAFRSALLSCAVHDTSLCAKILSRGDPKFEPSPSSTPHELKFECGDLSSGKLENDQSILGEFKSKSPLSMCFQNSYHPSHNCTPSKAEKLVARKGSISSLDHKKCITPKLTGSNWQQHPVIEQNVIKCTKRVHKFVGERNGRGSPRSKMLPNIKEKQRNTLKAEHNSQKMKHKKLASQTNAKKRKLEIENDLATSGTDLHGENNHTSKNLSTTDSNFLSKDLLNPMDRMLGTNNFQSNLENILHSVSSSEAASTPEGVATDTSFDSPFNNSNSNHRDCEFSDDDLEKSFELQIDPEIAHQASRLLEDNGLTEDDFNELFPEARVGDHKLPGRADLGDLGIDFTSNFDASDIDYSLFANIFPNFRSHQHESISVHQQF
ncbi:unnamed protein product [Allacma fusca]|uniref:KANL2-like probable zinc-finger domain-containing protein n=1 Tax=Allacma fusca TaxID=39272 RepID=A0A8J2JNE1_9HEXA|nr:unnamed protein product [Allacma fusca]